MSNWNLAKVMLIILFLALCSVIGGYLHHHQHLYMKQLEKRTAVSRTSKDSTTQVLIIGAGISGLEAARLLQKNGVKTLILEARNRTGGRIWSIRAKNGHILDMGASYIHGIHGSIPSGLLTNPLWDLVQEAKIPTQAKDQRDFVGSYLINDSISVIESWYNEYIAFVKEEIRTSTTNISLGHYANLFAQRKNLTGQQHNAFLNYVYFTIAIVEGAELDSIGAKGYFDIGSTFYGEEHIFPETGYMALTDYLAKNITDIRLEQVVTKINYNQELVEVSTRDGQIYRAEFVLVTVPLGVLKSKQIEFSPQLPEWKLGTIDRIGFNIYEKVYLLWNRSWWTPPNFSFVYSSSQLTELRYRGSSNKWNDKLAVRCVYTGNVTTNLISKLNQNEVIEEIRSTLQKMFPNITIPAPDETYMTDWKSDPFSFGSYSYMSIKQNYEDALYLSQPLNKRLLFAGEATSTDSYAYAHGALFSARREVTRLLFVYDLLPKQNTTTSRSSVVTPLEVLVIINFIWLQLCFN